LISFSFCPPIRNEGIAEGPDDNSLTLWSDIEALSTQISLPDIYWLCNEFHKNTSHGRAFLKTSRDKSDASLIFEASVRITDKTTIEFVKDFLSDNFQSADVLFEMTYKATMQPRSEMLPISDTTHISSSIIEQLLTNANVSCKRTEGNQVLARIVGQTKDDYILTVVFSAEADHTVKAIASITNTIPRQMWLHAFYEANAYNSRLDIRAGRAYLIFDIEEDEKKASLNYVSSSQFSPEIYTMPLEIFLLEAIREAVALFDRTYIEENVFSK
jgi:hypothetical protein